MKQEKTGAMSFFTWLLKTIKRSSSRRSSRLRTRAHYTYVANRPICTQARPVGDSGNGVLLSARLSEFNYCSLLLNSRGWHTGFACKKNFSKKSLPPARKTLSHVSRSRDLFLLGPISVDFRYLVAQSTASCHAIFRQSTVLSSPKNIMPKNSQAGISSKNKNDPRLEKRNQKGFQDEVQAQISYHKYWLQKRVHFDGSKHLSYFPGPGVDRVRATLILSAGYALQA